MYICNRSILSPVFPLPELNSVIYRCVFNSVIPILNEVDACSITVEDFSYFNAAIS